MYQVKLLKDEYFGTDFDYATRINVEKMNNEYTVKDKLTLLLLASGVFCFGLILPDSLSDHVKLVHFSAHFGMSFYLRFVFTCSALLNGEYQSLLLIHINCRHAFYRNRIKFWEIALHGEIGTLPILTIMDRSSVMTSMSQNLSGLLAGILLIEGLPDRNLIVSAYRSGNLHLIPGGMQVLDLPSISAGNLQRPLPAENIHTGSR
jgi:hypothetical protein